MRCEDISTHLADHLAGTLADATREEIDRHLQSCADCREELETLSALWQQLDDVPADAPDAHAMRARFDALVQGYEHGRARLVQQPLHRRFLAWLQQPRPVHPLLQACAALLVLAAGITLGRQLVPQTAPAPDMSAMHDELRELRQMVTLSLMQQQSASERLKGVSWSSQIESPGSEVVTALLDTLMHDANVNVRLAAIDALKRFADRDAVRRAAITALDSQMSPLVQMALIDFVVETREREAMPALRRLSHDEMLNAAVRARATWGLDRLEAAS